MLVSRVSLIRFFMSFTKLLSVSGFNSFQIFRSRHLLPLVARNCVDSETAFSVKDNGKGCEVVNASDLDFVDLAGENHHNYLKLL